MSYWINIDTFSWHWLLQTSCHLWQLLIITTIIITSRLHLKGEGEKSRRELAECDGDGVQIMVRGITAPIYRQHPAEVQQWRNPCTAISNTTKTGRPGGDRISKIRNYNVKDWHINIGQYVSILVKGSSTHPAKMKCSVPLKEICKDHRD